MSSSFHRQSINRSRHCFGQVLRLDSPYHPSSRRRFGCDELNIRTIALAPSCKGACYLACHPPTYAAHAVFGVAGERPMPASNAGENRRRRCLHVSIVGTKWNGQAPRAASNRPSPTAADCFRVLVLCTHPQDYLAPARCSSFRPDCLVEGVIFHSSCTTPSRRVSKPLIRSPWCRRHSSWCLGCSRSSSHTVSVPIGPSASSVATGRRAGPGSGFYVPRVAVR